MRRTSCCLLAGLLLGAAQLPAEILYSVTDLGTLGGDFNQGYGINNAGQVVGESDTGTGTRHAFLYSNGQMTDLGSLGGDYSIGNGINDAGQVVGYSDLPNRERHAFLYSNGQMTDLGTVPTKYRKSVPL